MKKFLFIVPFIAAVLFTTFGATVADGQFSYFPTRRYTAQINGATISYTITGRGEPLVLIHGYPLNGDLFSQQRRLLSLGFRIITIDLRGFGRSIAPNDAGSIDLYTQDVIDLLNLLNIQRAIIGGHSMGGAITLRLYQLAPQRFRGMILNDPAAMPPPTVEQFMWRGYQQQAREQGAASLVPLLLPEFLTGKTRSERPELVTEVTNQILAASVNGLVGGARALETRPDFRPLFPTISVPVLLLYGEEDSLTPVEQGRMLRQMIPNSELAVVRGATHGVIREEPLISNFVIENWASRNFGLNIQNDAPDGIADRLIAGSD